MSITETTTVKALLAVIIISLIVVFFFRDSLLGQELRKNATEASRNTYIATVISSYANIEKQLAGGEYDYTIKVTAQFNVMPKPTTDIDIVPVMEFKDSIVKAVTSSGSSFFRTSECTGTTCVFTAEVTSKIPPLSMINEVADTDFVLGQEYWLRTTPDPVTHESGIFKVRLHAASFFDECRAQFRLECRDAADYTRFLRVCKEEEVPNNECSYTSEMCGGRLTVQPLTLRCDTGNAEARVEASGGVDWKAVEVIKFSLYNKDCIENEDIKRLPPGCALLPNHIIEDVS